MKSAVELWKVCLYEAGAQHHVRTSRDASYALARTRTEGLSFLTIVLPSFEKDLLTAISQGKVDSGLFVGFRRRGGLPTFLSGFLRQLFDSAGMLRPDASAYVLQSVRQVLLLLSKVELPTTVPRERAAIRSYVDVDEGVVAPSDDLIAEFRDVVRSDFDRYISEVERRLFDGDWFPSHASGALATRESVNSRYGFLTWTDRLHEVLPWWDDMRMSFRQQASLDVKLLPREHEPPVRVTLVPKTQKSPRVIAMEPVWMMFVQQGLLRLMSDTLEGPSHRRLYNGLWWKDQEPNRLLALKGSVDGDLATLDLSDASDRVSSQLVDALFGDHKFLLRAVMACRSERSELPDGRVISLKKFASMGSALCFPVEAMVFYTICRIAQKRLGLSSTTLRVYGDDIIVDTRVAQMSIYLLEAFGLKVNARKSFTTGLFRESCGADWFKGENVGVVKLRRPLPDGQRQYDQIRSGVEFHNLLYGQGWYLTADKVRSLMKRALPRTLYTEPGSTVSAFWSWDQPVIRRLSPKLHREEILGYHFREVKPVDVADGEAALRKCSVSNPYRAANHLQRDGRSRCVGVNIGWTAT